mgnify:CR=1 FL=1
MRQAIESSIVATEPPGSTPSPSGTMAMASASDVAAFVVRLLNPEAVIEGVPRDFTFGQRKRRERRVRQIDFPPHMDRRNPNRPDRRGGKGRKENNN